MAFSEKNARFGKRAREVAWNEIYCKMLPEDMLVKNLWQTERDYKHDEDAEIEVFRRDLKHPVQISVQERFRRAKFAEHRDVTIAYYHEERGEPLHLFDSRADLLLYGYYDDAAGELLETVVADMTRIKWLVAQGAVTYDTRQHGDGSMLFVAIPFDDLEEEGALVFHRNR